MKKILELGSGISLCKEEGEVVRIDIHYYPDVDYVWDLEEGLPAGCNFSESFDVVVASHVFEHIVRLRRLLHEIFRVLKPSGLLKVRYPIGHNSFESIDHVHYFNERTFDVFVTDRGVNVGDFWLIEQKEVRETEVEVWLRKS